MQLIETTTGHGKIAFRYMEVPYVHMYLDYVLVVVGGTVICQGRSRTAWSSQPVKPLARFVADVTAITLGQDGRGFTFLGYFFLFLFLSYPFSSTEQRRRWLSQCPRSEHVRLATSIRGAEARRQG